MRAPDAYTLAHVRANRVIVECETCDRRGEYSTARLIETHGADITLPDLRDKLVTCPHANSHMLMGCKATYAQETRDSWQRRR